MPTSTVKHVSGPPQPNKTEPKWPVVLNPWLQFSKTKTCRVAARVPLLAVCGLLILAASSPVNAQTLQARISVISVAPARIRIDAEFPNATDVLSFRNTYGGVLGLGERIERVEAIAANGERVPVKKLAPGEFQNAAKSTRFRYEVSVAEPERPAQMSHVSWLNRDHGLLMLADLLPQSTRDHASFSAALIDVDAPTGWTVAANSKREGSRFSTADPETAVFLVGPSVHEKRQRLAATNLSIITSGKWPFSDNDAIKLAGEIIEEYSRVTRFALKSNAVLMLLPYPGETGPESWSAETRGNNVVLLLGRKASRKRVLAKLGIVLSHELFHLWVPNSLKLIGDYDWFFEGFTLYEALRMDLRLGLISFDDYLATIARVYDSYLSSADHARLSLIEASERRWTTSSSLVYDQGMLVAFFYDLSLRNLTDCRASLDDVYSELFRLSTTGQGNANETIIKVLSEREALGSFARDYIESARKLDLDSVVSAYGIQVQRGRLGANRTKLVVGRDLSKEQLKFLGCIGYRK
ncbi:MAG: M61 family metallopeptidase [Pyrinomonadaceae bacterium]